MKVVFRTRNANKIMYCLSWNKLSHALPVKSVFCYLKVKKDKGIILKTDKGYKIDCHADSGLAVLFVVEDGLKPICAKSRAGSVIKYCDVPILWVSQMQT
jgi:hypothetical protein